MKVYPEINHANLVIQLPMFRHNYKYTLLSEASACYKTMSMTKDIRSMYNFFFNILRLLLIFPVSSYKSERSFPCVRRLKTWLLSSMTQERLNGAVHVHKLTLDTASTRNLSKTFITGSYQRRNEIYSL